MQAIDKHFRFPLRVYYEDTDAGGVVYYANYLAFMERARTEWLRAIGYENRQLMDELGVVFAVRRACVDYLGPARLDDLLEVADAGWLYCSSTSVRYPAAAAAWATAAP